MRYGSRRVAEICLVLATLAGMTFGCAAPGDQGGASGPGGDGQSSDTDPNALNIGGYDFPYSEAAVAGFEERNPDIEVSVDPAPYSFENGQIQTALRSNGGPDVILTNSGPGRVGQLSESGLIRSLDDVYEKYDLASEYQPQTIDQIRTQGGGEIFEVVEGVDVFQVYYNRELFTEAGISPPDTWDGFLDNCRTLERAGTKPLTLGARDNFEGGWLLGSLVQSSAGRETMTDVLYEDGDFDQPDIVRGGEMLTEMIDAGCFDPEEALALDGEQSDASFINGEVAMAVLPQGPVIEAGKEGMDTSTFDTFLVPSRDPQREARATSGLALSWVVDADTNKMPAVEKWLEWVASEEYLNLAVENGAILVPVRIVPEDTELDPETESALEQLDRGTGYNPSVYLPNRGTEAWYAGIQGLLTGQESPESAMGGVQEALDEED